MTLHIKNGGVWKEATVYVKDGGTWKEVQEGYVKNGGTWKQFLISRVTSNITISSNTANYVLNTSKVSGYAAGKTDVTLTINSGVVVYSDSTGSYAFQVDNSWTTGDTITIINNGTILGKGGTGGRGWGSDGFIGGGTSGGSALNVLRAVTINNGSGRIAGGGGGGGGGGASYIFDGEVNNPAGGGGGGGGIGNGVGGSGGSHPAYGSFGGSGGNGTLTSAGGGGASGSGASNVGGSGGSYGSSGSSGGGSSGGSGGSAGAAVVGNTNITWTATGTRNGGIS